MDEAADLIHLSRGDPLPSADVVARAIHAILTGRTPAALPTGRRSAVLILLFDRLGAPHIVLTRRPEDVVHHPGQVCLPGGSFEPGDAHLEQTALRETHEEIGVPSDSVRVLGALDDVSTSGTGFTITPFVGVLDGPLRAAPNAVEIARLHEVPLADVLSAHRSLPEAPTVATLRYALGGEDVWGATARILRQFCDLVDAALGATRAATVYHGKPVSCLRGSLMIPASETQRGKDAVSPRISGHIRGTEDAVSRRSEPSESQRDF